jgi:hypothetical protein
MLTENVAVEYLVDGVDEASGTCENSCFTI